MQIFDKPLFDRNVRLQFSLQGIPLLEILHQRSKHTYILFQISLLCKLEGNKIRRVCLYRDPEFETRYRRTLVVLRFSNIDRKIFQTFPNNCTLRLSHAFYLLLRVSACITKLKDCGAIKGGNSGCGNSGCEIGAATSASRQREGSRFERHAG